jgi:hypothetical protein
MLQPSSHDAAMFTRTHPASNGRNKHYARWLNRMGKGRFVPNLIREDGWEHQGANSDFLKSCSGKFADPSDGAHFTSQLEGITHQPPKPPFRPRLPHQNFRDFSKSLENSQKKSSILRISH